MLNGFTALENIPLVTCFMLPSGSFALGWILQKTNWPRNPLRSVVLDVLPPQPTFALSGADSKLTVRGILLKSLTGDFSYVEESRRKSG